MDRGGSGAENDCSSREPWGALSRLLQSTSAVALLLLPDATCAQSPSQPSESVKLPEVTVAVRVRPALAPRPRPVRTRAAPPRQPARLVSPTPLSGSGIEREKVAATVQSLSSDDFARTASPNVTDTILQRVPGA